MFKINQTLMASLFIAGLGHSYIIKNGDTMWDLSAKQFQDPFKWSTLWQANPKVKNPNLIYPGQSLNMPGDNNAEDYRDQGADSRAVAGNTAIAEADFQRRLGKLAHDPKHKKINFDPPHSGLKADHAKAQWLNPMVQLKSPYWVTPYGDTQVFATEFDLSKDDVRNRPQIVQTGQDYEISLDVNERLQVNQRIEIFESNEPVVQVQQKDGSYKKLVLHKPLGFGKVKEINGSTALVGVDYLITPARVEFLKFRPNPNRFPVNVNSYDLLNEVDLKNAAQLVYQPESRKNAVTGDFVMLNMGLADGFASGDAVVIWDQLASDTTKNKPKIVGYGVVVHSDAVGSSVMINRILDQSHLPTQGDLVSVYAKANR